MKFEIDFSPLPDYVLIRTEGQALVEGFEELLKALTSSPEWKSGSKQLLDHRNLLLEEVSSEEIRRIVGLVGKHGKDFGIGPCAFVVANSLGFGLSRMYELLGGEAIHSRTGVFYEMDEAINWLKKQ